MCEPVRCEIEAVTATRFRVVHPTGSGNPHKVDLLEHGPQCDCEDFAYRGRQRPCKHIRAVLDAQTDDPQAELIDRLTDEQTLDILGQRDKPPRLVDRPLTELSFAEDLVAQHGRNLRHVRVWGAWLAYDGQRWARDETGAVERLQKELVRARIRSASDVTTDRDRAIVKGLLQFSTAHHLRAALELASTESEVASTADVFDQDTWALNVRNGTIDLRTGLLRPHSRDDLITKCAPVAYDPDATCPRWERFLDEVLAGDADLKAFTQRAVGYTLTGETSEQVVLFFQGPGANGKTVFTETIQTAVLGAEYVRTASFDTFLDRQRRAGAASPDLARLHGVRLVAASEAPAGRALNEALLKQLTGGDTIAARFLHENEFEFRPQFKLWLRANHRPPMREQTVALWRRMKLVPFDVTIPDKQRDKALSAKLVAEAPGILAWAVRGCLAWQNEGLGEPARVSAATSAYREENDVIAEFLEARGVLDPGAWTATADLYRAFTAWWETTHARHESPLNSAWFGRLLGERSDVEPKRQGDARTKGWRGVRLLDGALTSSLDYSTDQDSGRNADDDLLPF